MLLLELYDREGTKLNFGDIVKISDGLRFQFYAEIKYIESENIITPFHTFSFLSFVKVDKLPENLTKSTEDRYGIWWAENPEEDTKAEEHKSYLSSWRQCEHFINKRCWRIKIPTNKQLELFQ